MSLFLSTFTNPIDRKGRVSVPAAFRSALAGQNFQGVVLMRSPIHAALEGFPYSMMEEMAQRLDNFALFSSDQNDLAASLFAEAVALAFDSEGRMTLPAPLGAHAGIKDAVCFVGLGRSFQVWEPAAWAARRAQAQSGMKARGLTLPPLKGQTP